MTAAADRLRQLVERAEMPLRIAGIPTGVISSSDWDVTDEVLELFTPLALLVCDMADALETLIEGYVYSHPSRADVAALLARLDTLTEADG